MMIVAIAHNTSRHTTTSIGANTAMIIFELMFVIVAVLVTVGETAPIPPAVVVDIIMATVSVVTEVLVVVMATVSVLDGFVVAVIVDNIVDVDLSVSTLFMYCIVIVDVSGVGAADDTDGEGIVTFSQSQTVKGTRLILLKSQKQHWIGCSTVALIF